MVAADKLAELAKLEPDWDSYGATPPTAGAIAVAHQVLLTLLAKSDRKTRQHVDPWMIAPLADGGVQLEWRGAGGAIEVEIDPDGALHYLRENSQGDIVEASDDDITLKRADVVTRILQVLTATRRTAGGG